MPLTVAIIGRPNVGKSTLFNRLVGKRVALVDDVAGVTRDRRQAKAKIADLLFDVIDTAGLEDIVEQNLSVHMRHQTEVAIQDADVILFIVDGREGITPLDKHFAQFLRKQKRHIILCANKCERQMYFTETAQAYSFGFGDCIAISAEHGQGMEVLYDALKTYIYTDKQCTKTSLDHHQCLQEENIASPPLNLAVVGRPNAGKSTLVNALLKEDRMITGAQAGITRDSIASYFMWKDRQVKLVDTAGLRRRGRVVTKIEKLSAVDSLRAIRFAQVVALLLDMQLGIEKQDFSLASTVVEEGRALVIVANKWDLVKDKTLALKTLKHRIANSLPQVRGVKIIPLSAVKKHNLNGLMQAVFATFRTWNMRISTAKLNTWLQYRVQRHPPPLAKGSRIKIRYITQIKTRPPTFYLSVSKPDAIPESYLRYLAQGLREDFDLWGIAIRIYMRKGNNPYI